MIIGSYLLVQDLEEELEMKDSLIMQELAIDDHKSQSPHNSEQSTDGNDKEYVVIQKTKDESFSKIEAELEMLELNMSSSTLERRISNLVESTVTWGPGGVAFVNPEANNQHKTFMCLYRITLEQFNDVLLQPNVSSDASSFFSVNALSSIENKKNISLESLKNGWYHNVVYLGKEKGIPILTMTCTRDDVEDFKTGKVPLRPPAKEYADTLVRGLVHGKQLSDCLHTTSLHQTLINANSYEIVTLTTYFSSF
ncbi:hypothetical protein L2E82_13091 [Cichorium intybus]|uniref:Uncharacterized protein n=1 Tax=Cichorium intybus TaxID=13427 RepID=A0ACB9GHM3_CICIN|nr:hypothetical protein L2E82_13091 [Cichorium intybus]